MCLSFNIDGLPLFKSSQESLWPVLCSITNIKPAAMFPVVLTYGKSTPNDLTFLEEVIRIQVHYEAWDSFWCQYISVSLWCIVCDAPARALVRRTKLYSGYFGCDKCCQKGRWAGRVIYADIVGLELRTNFSFRNKSNKEHHHFRSPFCELPIDMVKRFPIDYMHQTCLGVVKKIAFVVDMR